MLIVLKLIHMLRKSATLKTSGHASATAFFSVFSFSKSKVRPHIPVCVNHMSSESAKNTADISRLLGKHSETERNSEFFCVVTGGKCFFHHLHLQKAEAPSKDEGGTGL